MFLQGNLCTQMLSLLRPATSICQQHIVCSLQPRWRWELQSKFQQGNRRTPARRFAFPSTDPVDTLHRQTKTSLLRLSRSFQAGMGCRHLHHALQCLRSTCLVRMACTSCCSEPRRWRCTFQGHSPGRTLESWRRDSPTTSLARKGCTQTMIRFRKPQTMCREGRQCNPTIRCAPSLH